MGNKICEILRLELRFLPKVTPLYIIYCVLEVGIGVLMVKFQLDSSRESRRAESRY